MYPTRRASYLDNPSFIRRPQLVPDPSKDEVMSFPLRRLRRAGLALVPIAGVVALSGCAAPPATQASGTPAAHVAAESMVSLQANGVSVGAAVAVSGRYFVTNAHVLRQASGTLHLRRADGGEAVVARLVGTSPRMDLAVLEAPEGFARPAALAWRAPRPGEPVWAVGPQGLGRALAAGHVTRPRVEMQGFGPGFTAGLGALMGFSGGPVVDAQGQVLGLTTALPTPGAALAMAMLTGVDVMGYAQGEERQVFALGIQAVLLEAQRLTGMGPIHRPRPGTQNFLAANLRVGE